MSGPKFDAAERARLDALEELAAEDPEAAAILVVRREQRIQRLAEALKPLIKRLEREGNPTNINDWPQFFAELDEARAALREAGVEEEGEEDEPVGRLHSPTGFRMYITCPACHDPGTHLEIPSPTDRSHTGYWYNECPNCGAGVEFQLTDLLPAEPADDIESMYYITTTITPTRDWGSQVVLAQ